MIEFKEFDKIPRFNRSVIITEKIDGTNAQVNVARVAAHDWPTYDTEHVLATWHADEKFVYALRAGSRNRWITPDDDNFGFAKWVQEHSSSLITGLGEGRHYGEWWGAGIQRRYGLTEKRFILFNTHRWTALPDDDFRCKEVQCCHVVPMLYTGKPATPSGQNAVDVILASLAFLGSVAAKGFKDPEGVIVYHTALQGYFKATVHNDEYRKSDGSKA